MRRVRVAPHGRKVAREGEDALALAAIDGDPVGHALALVLFLCLGEVTQPRVPLGFQRVGDEAVGRIDLHVTAAGVVGLVLRPLDLPVTQAIGLVEARLNLLLDGDRYLERHRRHRLDQQLPDGSVDLRSDDALAHGVAEEPTAAHAHIVGDELPSTSLVVVDVLRSWGPGAWAWP